MGARTCLLCGKPLSRIWVGAGDDFCSREHRNQYRLRRGMDRLLEANRVASVMRRRESPRQIPMHLLRSAGPDSYRALVDPPAPRERRAPDFSTPALEPQLETTLGASSDFRGLAAIPGAQRGNERVEANPLPFPLQPALAPPVVRHMAAQVAPAPAANLARAAAGQGRRQRVLTAPRRGPAQPFRGEPRQRITAPDANLASAPPLIPKARGWEGRALRVSMAAGFQVPASELRGVTLAYPAIAGMKWPGLRRSAPRQSAGPDHPAAFAIRIEQPPLRAPGAPPLAAEGGIRWPGPLGIRLRFLNAANEWRTASAPFGYPDEFVAKERR